MKIVLGTMNFGPQLDESASREMVDGFLQTGYRELDTAYVYTGSEAALGEVLARNGIREKVNIATKLPQYLISSRTAIDKYFNEELIGSYSKKEYSFFLGYYVHLLTDIDWTNDVYCGLLKAYPKEAAQDKNKLVWTAKGDWYDIDFLYLEEHPDFRAFHIYESAVDYDNEFMDIFSKDAFENRRQYICGFYRSDNHGDLHRKYTYLTPEQSADFVDRTVQKILTQKYL